MICYRTLFLCLFVCQIPILAQSLSKGKEPSLECAIGQWGNDYSICGTDAVNKPGKGQIQKRKDEELTLVFDKDGTGYFRFYDCQSKRKFTNDITFTYRVVKNQIRFRWAAKSDEVQNINATFNFTNSYRLRCTTDTLFFVDGILKNSLYMNTNYFIRRK